MATEILSRALLAIAIAGVGVGVYGLANRVILMQASKKSYRGLDGFKPGIPAILYFTTPACVLCKTVQRPAIQLVQQNFGDNLQVIEIDASKKPELANYWGMLSVPTTFVISKEGEPRHVNHGVTDSEKLLNQIEKFA